MSLNIIHLQIQRPTLPDEGWMHPCTLCLKVISDTLVVKVDNNTTTRYRVALCGECKMRVISNPEIQKLLLEAIDTLVELRQNPDENDNSP